MTSAAAISGVLRRAGFRPVPVAHRGEGIRVTGRGGAGIYVRCSFDSSRDRFEFSADVTNVLIQHGYEVLRISDAVLRVKS